MIDKRGTLTIVTIGLTGYTGLIGHEVLRSVANSTKVLTIGRSEQSAIRLDLASASACASADLSGIDSLVHCSGITDESLAADPDNALRLSTSAFAALINNAIQRGVRRFVYLSSAHVYGPLEGTINENTPANPLALYSLAHYCGEQLLKAATLRHPVAAVILRPCAVFGLPWSLAKFNRWRLIPFSFPYEIASTGSITLKTPGLQQRNFVSTTAIAQIIADSLQDAPEPGSFTIINPTGPATLSVYDFACLCAGIAQEKFGRRVAIQRPTPPPGEAAAALHYASLRPGQPAGDTPDKFVASILSKLLEDSKRG